MKMAKRIFAAACALSLACSMAACGSSSSDSSSSKKEAKAMTDDQKEQVNALQDKSRHELSNKTIKWMAHYDINPSDGKSESPAISLFQTKYGGKIEYVQTTWDNRYTDLAKAVMANDSPDFFPADDMDAFPKGAIKAMFEPIDDVVDFSSDIWSSSQTLNDSFVFNGKHYVAAIDVRPQYVCTYNTKTISDFGYDDPASFTLMTSGHGASSQRCALTLQTLKLTDMLLMVTGTAKLLTILAVIHLSVLRTASL